MGNKITFIDQCSKANQLIKAKWRFGFNEGDYIWDGEQVRLIGHDFIDLKEVYNEHHGQYFHFAMIKDEPVHVDSTDYPHEISFKHATYVAESIRNPVWIPTQEQLQHLLVRINDDYLELLKRFIYHTEYNNSYKASSKSEEQLWLEYFMWVKHNMRWDVLSNNWYKDTRRLNEEI